MNGWLFFYPSNFWIPVGAYCRKYFLISCFLVYVERYYKMDIIYYRSISMFTQLIYIETFSSKLTTHELFLYFWVKSKYIFCSYAFYYLNYLCGIIRRNTLDQKMNMVFICSNLYKINYLTLINTDSNLLC